MRDVLLLKYGTSFGSGSGGEGGSRDAERAGQQRKWRYIFNRGQTPNVGGDAKRSRIRNSDVEMATSPDDTSQLNMLQKMFLGLGLGSRPSDAAMPTVTPNRPSDASMPPASAIPSGIPPTGKIPIKGAPVLWPPQEFREQPVPPPAPSTADGIYTQPHESGERRVTHNLMSDLNDAAAAIRESPHLSPSSSSGTPPRTPPGVAPGTPPTDPRRTPPTVGPDGIPQETPPTARPSLGDSPNISPLLPVSPEEQRMMQQMMQQRRRRSQVGVPEPLEQYIPEDLTTPPPFRLPNSLAYEYTNEYSKKTT